MKTTDILLLDLLPTGGLGGALRGILETAQAEEIRLQQETVFEEEPEAAASGVINKLVARANPALIFLVSTLNRLRQARTLIQTLRQEHAEPPLIVVSEAEEPNEVFELLQVGATDFITPPLKAVDIFPRVWRVLERARLALPLPETLPETLQRLLGAQSLIGASPAFLAAVGKIPLVAKCDVSVLIAGETGTGKELCARAIHDLSPRAARPFIPVNCGAIPHELVENELFGHERGAFTGAGAAKTGLIEAADGGTLFLDEIDSLPLLAQVKLLRFLQEKEYRPLGSTQLRHADVRVVTATNINVEKAVREGRLRQDLYYRLNILPLVLPPLRERREDIPRLAQHFLAKHAVKFDKPLCGFAAEALHKLLLYDWPGNVRELEHVIERAVVLAEQTLIGSRDIVLSQTPAVETQESFQELKAKLVEQFERTYLQSLLVAHQGNITKAAEAAQKNRRAFFQLLRKHGIDAREFREKG